MYLIRQIKELNILSHWLLLLQLGLMSSKRVDKTISLYKIGAKLRYWLKYLWVTYNMNRLYKWTFSSLSWKSYKSNREVNIFLKKSANNIINKQSMYKSYQGQLIPGQKLHGKKWKKK